MDISGDSTEARRKLEKLADFGGQLSEFYPDPFGREGEMDDCETEKSWRLGRRRKG